MRRREILRHITKAGLLLPFTSSVLFQGRALAATQENLIFFYYPNGCISSDMSRDGFQTQALRSKGVPFKVHNAYLNGVPGGAHEGAIQVLRAGQGNTSADHLIASKLDAPVLNVGLRSEGVQDRFRTSWKNGFAQDNISNPAVLAEYLQSLNGGGQTSEDPNHALLLETLIDDFETLKSLAAKSASSSGLREKLDLHMSAIESLKPKAINASESLTGSCQFISIDDPFHREGGGGESGGQIFQAVAEAQLKNVAAAFSCGGTRVANIQVGYGDENPGMLNFGYVESCWRYMQQAGVPVEQRYWTESTNHSASHKAPEQHKAMNAYVFELMGFLYEQISAAGLADTTTILAYSDVGDGANHGPDNGGIIEIGKANLSGPDFKGFMNSAAKWMGAGTIF